MALLKNLYEDQIIDVLAPAATARARAVITVRNDGRWINMPSKVLSADDDHVWVEAPSGDGAAAEHQLSSRQTLAISFKLKHHKYLFTSKLEQAQQIELDDGEVCEALQIVLPERMQRLSRRTFERVDVPANRIVRSSFWPGGCDAEPTGGEEDGPVFLGAVTNISAGGFSVRTDKDVQQIVEVGFVVGVRLVFGVDGEAVYADAQCRHITLEDESIQLGFQFLGLGHTAAGREALRTIGRKVSEYQHQARVAEMSY